MKIKDPPKVCCLLIFFTSLQVIHLTEPTDVISQELGDGNSFCGSRTLMLIDQNSGSNFTSNMIIISGDSLKIDPKTAALY